MDQHVASSIFMPQDPQPPPLEGVVNEFHMLAPVYQDDAPPFARVNIRGEPRRVLPTLVSFARNTRLGHGGMEGQELGNCGTTKGGNRRSQTSRRGKGQRDLWRGTRGLQVCQTRHGVS